MKLQQFLELDSNKKLEEIYKSVEKTRKSFTWTLIISLLFIILPLIGLVFVIPKFLEYFSNLSGLGL
jgi:hypothetical protein